MPLFVATALCVVPFICRHGPMSRSAYFRNRSQTGGYRDGGSYKLSARRILALRFSRLERFETENRFAILHQVEAIARNCLQIGGIILEQVHVARLAGEQSLLLVDLRLKIVDFAM